MLMSIEHHENHWDEIPRRISDLNVHLNDRMKLHKKGFNVSKLIMQEEEQDDDSYGFHD